MHDALLHLADTNLIMGHRLSEWTGHGPALEQDIALTNIALDYVGLSRNAYQYAADLLNDSPELKVQYPLHSNGLVTEDSLAYLRDAIAYRNFLLCELPNGDWAHTILRLFFYAAWQKILLSRLQQHSDSRFSGIAAKSVKELQYHEQWSADWVIRLGDGTEESARRMQQAMERLWPYTGEMFEAGNPLYILMDKEAAADIQLQWNRRLQEVFSLARLSVPERGSWHQSGGLKGSHTEHLGYLLAEMQYLQRAYPGAEW